MDMGYGKMVIMKNKGITLIELLIVIAIIGILIIALAFSFEGWTGKYRVESQIKEMYADLMNTRVKAMSRNRVHFVTIAANQYTIHEDTAPAPDGNGVQDVNDTQLPGFPKTNLRYGLAWALALGGDTVTFSTQGTTTALGTICAYTTFDPDYDCIVISPTRINMGKIAVQGVCNADNCVVR
ncbi:MAG: hypothetical protein CVV37_05855 [Nitrospira bacterium HGW-Nitrospira-1]|nr:MAG: hypothetical protein CVV37_05855 [Nitrospira bacterium HGW-Nitrospira-1]